ncbi:AAA family ATPase [Streptomyces sp. KR80]|uniref:AAA family ATPase n=1 Tax=Streptomyces sp. KR80 TaxID=3457426 RepID=UPI003FCF7553
MRLHRLRISAFGPFGGTEEVDFDELSAAGVFLLHGPTGAGKTSVLDAVCYALYGGVPGARQSGQSLRSDHADPLTPTEVLLDLTVGGRRLEIIRRPEQYRPKKRGEGFTRDKAQTLLSEYAHGRWKGLSRSHQEVGEEIAQLLGMSREQFCQVVLLPQGDFARFLRADAEARAKVLGRLFDTRRFAAVEERLAELRAVAQHQVRRGDERLLALAHRMHQAAGDGAEPGGPLLMEPDPAGTRLPEQRSAVRPRARADGALPAPGDLGLADAVLRWAALARTSARERLDIAAAAVRAAESAHRSAQRTSEDVRECARLQHAHADARRRSAELADRGEEFARLRARLERARSADVVVPALDLRDTAEREQRAAVTALRYHREALARELSGPVGKLGGTSEWATTTSEGEPGVAAVGADPPEPRAGLLSDLTDAGAWGHAPWLRRGDPHPAEGWGSLAAVERELRAELGRLAAARRSEQRAARLAAERADLDHESRADDEVLEEAAGWLAEWESVRLRLQQRIDTALEAGTRAEQLGAHIEPALRRLDAAERRDHLADRVREAEERWQQARSRAADTRQQWLELKERRLDGIAAELAAQLRSGEPCKVCGATEHPAPARTSADHVDRAAEDVALQAHQRADAAREQADSEVRTLREALAGAAAAAGDTPLSQLRHEVRTVQQAHTNARAVAADTHAAREALARAEREYECRRTAQQEAERRAAARTSRRDALAREQAELEAELARARGGAPSVADRAAQLERLTALVGETGEAVRTAEATARRLKEADARLADAAFPAGFGTPQAAADARLADAERRELQRCVDQWQAETAAVARELADPRTTAAAALPAADPAAAQAAVETATLRLREASAQEDAARTRCAELDRLSAEATADARRLAPLRTEYERVARLAALAAGTSAENEHRMRLESYVLAARLEQVAAAASVRLQRMSAGRYTLVHTDARAGGRGRSGLGLQVVDAWTGSERDTATLSGGETFFASLSLALGLADVVTDEAGGTRLDTLFIDEGFGSLDEQTLDDVLDVLDALRERDRTVGIVSHIADLRQRIPAQLEVVKERSGSSVRHRAPRTGT